MKKIEAENFDPICLLHLETKSLYISPAVSNFYGAGIEIWAGSIFPLVQFFLGPKNRTIRELPVYCYLASK